MKNDKIPPQLQQIERFLGRAMNLGDTMDRIRRAVVEGPIDPRTIDMVETAPNTFEPRKRTTEEKIAANNQHTFGAFFRALDKASRTEKR